MRGVYGHECINEMIAGNIADILGISHLKYDLLHAKVKINDKIYETWLTRSVDFKESGEHKLTFETYFEMNQKPDEEVWEYILRNDLQNYFYDVFVLDYIICNRDRHGANVEVLEKRGTYRLAPIFDNGLSFLFSCYKDGVAMKQFDYKKDGPVNNYVGSVSLLDNLKKVPVNRIEQILKAEWDEKKILDGLKDVLSDEHAVPKEYRECILKMISERVEYIEKIFNKG